MFAIDWHQYLLFLAATTLICIIPGPDMLYILATVIRGGTKAGIVAALGMSLGMSVYTVAVGVGLSAFLSAFQTAFFALQICGSGYLILIGIQTLRTTYCSADMGERMERSLSITFRQAVLTNLMNPKTAVFYIAYLPQFANRALGHMTSQLLILGFSFLLIGLLFDSLIAVLCGNIGTLLSRNAKIQTTLHYISAAIYFGLGVFMFVAATT